MDDAVISETFFFRPDLILWRARLGNLLRASRSKRIEMKIVEQRNLKRECFGDSILIIFESLNLDNAEGELSAVIHRVES